MRLLIDSHVYLWMLYDPEHLGASARRALESADRLAVSTATLWELTLKSSKGTLPHPLSELLTGAEALGIDEIEIARRHLQALDAVVLPHADPFDALLVAQAESDGLHLVTADRMLLRSAYATIDARG